MSEVTSLVVLNEYQDVDNFVERISNLKNTQVKIRSVIEMIGFPVTIVKEDIYVDKVYRDMYYTVFSGKHFDYRRDCRRLSFFKNRYTNKSIWSKYKKNKKTVENDFVGTMVLRPLRIGEIGRTLINPGKLNIPTAFIRTTKFTIEVMGMLLHTEAYPFSEQDSEVMTCAETTIWSILEYYGNRYSSYKAILPHDITECVDSISVQRVMPSRGLDYQTVSMVLKNFGFQPKVYAKADYNEELKKIFHYYVESGIPIAVGTDLPQEASGHSTVCIGHAKEEYLLPVKKMMYKLPNGMVLVDTCQFHSNYVIIDDNQIGYTIEPFDDFTKYSPAIVDVIAVPLYKKIYMDAKIAADVFDCIAEVFSDYIKIMLKAMGIIVDYDNPLIKRVYLTSSRKYKEYRTSNAEQYLEAKFYRDMICPKFLWVMELSTFHLYKEKKIIADITLDATSVRGNWKEYIISIRIMNHATTRRPNQSFDQMMVGIAKYNKYFSYTYPIYSNNLKEY